MLLDWRLSDGEGVALLGDICKSPAPRRPVIMLTARGGLADRIRGLDNDRHRRPASELVTAVGLIAQG